LGCRPHRTFCGCIRIQRVLVKERWWIEAGIEKLHREEQTYDICVIYLGRMSWKGTVAFEVSVGRTKRRVEFLKASMCALQFEPSPEWN
jgi:hypothetical protein